LKRQKNLIASARNTFYNLFMARGWESKSVESQMEAAKNKDEDGPSSPREADDAERKARRELQGLLLSRAYVLRQIESSSNERYTQSLRQALSEIEQKIARLEPAR
jgi:hypothetical protein